MDLLYEDDLLIAISKPPGVSVHEAPGPGTSLLRFLRERHGFADLRPVHRLDKGVSGVLLLAKNRESARWLERHWSEVQKSYLALCEGVPAAHEGQVDAPILEHQTGKPYRMTRAIDAFREQSPGAKCPPPPPPKTSAVHPAGRPACTRYRLLEHGRVGSGTPLSATGIEAWSVLEVRPEQGRMHQLRVHLAHLGTPLLVDPLYGRRAELSGSGAAMPVLARVSLHAAKLTFPHPSQNGQMITIEALLPEDLSTVIASLRGPP